MGASAISVALFIAVVAFVERAQAAPAGTLDPTFTGGVVTTHFADEFADVRGLVVQPDGKLVVAGRTGNIQGIVLLYDDRFHSNVALARYLPDGSLDPTFGIGGVVVTDVPGNVEYASCLALQPDGKLVAAGATGQTQSTGSNAVIAVFRYLPDGTLDPSFGTGGVGRTTGSFGTGMEVTAVVIQSDGKIVVTGDGLARFNADGTVDTSFGTAGLVRFYPTLGRAHALVLQPDGKLVTAGASAAGGDLEFARFNADGTLDASFGTAGIADIDLGNYEVAHALALRPDGKLIAAGSIGTSWLLVRLDASGSLDPSFGTSGATTLDPSPALYDDLDALAVQSDGKITVAGYVSILNSERLPALARFHDDGTLDTSFGNGGMTHVDLRRGRDVAWALALQPDGKLVLGGGYYSFVVARYLGGTCGDGTPDGGEECDDGNLANGDGCDAACCLSDTDGDGQCDSLDPCTGPLPAQATKITASRLDTTPPSLNNTIGDDTFSLSTEVVLAHPFIPTLDPVANGLRFLIVDVSGTPMDVTLPGGAFANPPNTGWTALPVGSLTPTRWRYVDKRHHPLYAITGASVQDKSNRTPGLVKAQVKGKRGYYTDLAANLPLSSTVVLDPPTGAQCAAAEFPGPSPAPSCTLLVTKITCK